MDSQSLHVGAGQQFATLTAAITAVIPGDTIIIHEGIYAGGLFFANVQGLADHWITIRAANDAEVIFRGGNNAWQFSDAALLHILDIIFEHQTGNGVNFDDGGTFDTPARHIIFERCTFRDISAQGNNDLLKLSGVDSFAVRNCVFLNGAAGGSGIDMVGCHDGIISGCTFVNMGSNAIQAKGGSRNIRIEGNSFRDCGHRSINIGGSTGLQFFRPQDAEYEAAEIRVYANIFIGSTAPVAFVGCIDSEVVNNTIYLPENWVLRILQETVDPTRFHPCGNNAFVNNLIVIDNRVNVVCNIGPNTAPETFTFANNLWYHMEQPGWSGPVLPATEQDGLTGEDPLLSDPGNDDFALHGESPAIARGLSVAEPVSDFFGNAYHMPRSIGAVEGFVISSVRSADDRAKGFIVFPNPAHTSLTVWCHEPWIGPLDVFLYPLHKNTPVRSLVIPAKINRFTVSTADLLPGVYFLHIRGDGIWAAKVVIGK